MNLIGTTTKTIKTYGKKSSERVITVNNWNYEVGEKLEEQANLSGNISIKNTAKENSLKKGTAPKLKTDKSSIPQRSTNVTKNAEKKQTERYTETKQRN